MMASLFSILALGFFLGVRHATDADHVVAVATIVSQERRFRSAAAIGGLWGLGHGVTVTVVGGVILLFGLVLPPRLGLATEFAVGVMLALLGSFTLRSLWASAPHRGVPGPRRETRSSGVGCRLHGHDPDHHRAEGVADAPPCGFFGACLGRRLWLNRLRPVIVGVVHGLAGSAAIALLVLATVREPLWGFAYLIVFGLGTILGMIALTIAIALPFRVSSDRPRVSAGLRAISGLLSLLFGFFLMYQIGVADGLFSVDPRWEPR